MKFLLLTFLVCWVSHETTSKNIANSASFQRHRREAEQTVLANTKLGTLKALVLTSRDGYEYNAFLGVPFAEKPERFEVAQPVKPWQGVRDALNFSSVCPQKSHPAIGPAGSGNEDCLYLNVFSPVQERCQNETNNLPVLFLIHGGGFVVGSGGLYDPYFFMDECIVYVSINYRLGALGFLTTQDGVVPGNLGLKDALLALKWTNQYIESFRGNKDSVTITGQSAGAILVSHFLASPAAKGLLHRVIAQSGSSLTPFVVKDPKQNAVKLGQLIGCTDEASDALKACLKSKTAEEITNNQDQVKNWVIDLTARFAPVVEPVDAVEPFQTADPYLRIKRGEGSRVPLITGVTKDEGILLNAYATLQNKPALEELNSKWNEIAPIEYFYDHLNITNEERDKISEEIKNFYLGGKPVGPETEQGFTDSESDRYFNFGAWEEASLHSKYAPVYHYSLTFKGNYSYSLNVLQPPKIVVSHGHDTQFFYKFDFVPLPEPGSDRLRFSHTVIKLWTSFIKTGSPTDVYPKVHTWENFTPQHPSTLILDLPAENVPDYKLERMKFWDKLNLRKLEFPGA